MSNIDFKSKKTDKVKARKLVVEIATKHPKNVMFSNHALEKLKKDNLTLADAWNVLKGTAKIHQEGEFERGSYRYRLETNFLMLVVAFWPDGKGLNVITGWDKRKKGKM